MYYIVQMTVEAMLSSLFPLGNCYVSDGGGRKERGERDMFTCWCAIEPIELEKEQGSCTFNLNIPHWSNVMEHD